MSDVKHPTTIVEDPDLDLKVYNELKKHLSPGASDFEANMLDIIMSYTGCLGLPPHDLCFSLSPVLLSFGVLDCFFCVFV